jgi:ATP-dependent Lon protease
MTFEEILKQRGLRFAQFLNDSGIEDINSFVEILIRDRNQEIDRSALEQLIDSYRMQGVIEEDDGIARTREEALAVMSDDSRTRLKDWIFPHGESFESTSPAEKLPSSGSAKKPHLTAEPDRSDSVIEVTANKSDDDPREQDLSSTESAQLPETIELLWQDSRAASPETPIMVLDGAKKQLPHHLNGTFLKPGRGFCLEYPEPSKDGIQYKKAPILYLDRRFVRLYHWLADQRFLVCLSGANTKRGYAVYKIHTVERDIDNESQQTTNDALLQLVIHRMLLSHPKNEPAEDVKPDYEKGNMELTSLASIKNFLSCAEESLPEQIRYWAHRNLWLLDSETISPEEKRHAQRALQIMLNIEWENPHFQAIDPIEARKVLDDQLYGMEKVKQRVIETIIQINRTHTLPAYGILLNGPAGTGKSQIAYAVARILKLPWAALDMSAIHDSEALTGSPRVYTNAKPGRIMEAFSQAGSSNLVFLINELDKASGGSGSNGNPADALLTLLDNLGFTDNYIECRIPTNGVYPIATSNDKSKISPPLLSRFAVIDIPDYTAEEKRLIFKDYVLPKILKRMGMQPKECVLTKAAVNAVVEYFQDQPGVRDLEQAAEHIAANALYRIETERSTTVTYDNFMIRELLEL